MTDFPIYAQDAEIVLHLPNSIGEIPAEWLTKITDDVKVANYYSLIAVVYREKLSSVILAKTQKKDIKAAVTPIFIKAGSNDNEYINNIHTKDKLIISNTQLSLAHHCVVPNNELSFEHVMKVMELDGKNTYQRSLQHFNNAYVCFVEFKIIPNSDIIGYYTPQSAPYTEQFIDVIGNVQGEA